MVNNGKRVRRFYDVDGDLVVLRECIVSKWKCRGCKRTFTQYPSFAAPFKRYTRATIERLCAKYLEEAKATYRRVIC
jgi:hypothetical protein